jgi:hypothetical protein
MKKAALIIALALTFVALFPISWRLADPLFTHPFRQDLSADPVLLVCPDRVEIRWLHELPEDSPMGAGCTFNVAPERQVWVEKAVPALLAPAPGKASWFIRVKQIGPTKQQIDLELRGDGIFGMIYEVTQNQIAPLRSRVTGPGGAFSPFIVNVILWGTGWLAVMNHLSRSEKSPTVI